MSLPAIEVRGLWKEYEVGAAERKSTFYDLLSESVSAPFRRWRRLRGEESAAERFWALQDVSFDVMQGDVLGVIGRNGAGKSTLLKILSRITAPSRGHVTVRGRMASLLEVGTGFHPELSGRENIFLNGALLGMSRADIAKKFDEIVDFAEVDKFIDTPVKRYSSGMYVRLAFAVASHLEPEILVVDEVLAVGDFEFQRKCLGKMQDVSGDGRTVLFVSHNLAAVQVLCGKALLLDGGEVRRLGPTSEVVTDYLENVERGGGTIESMSGDLRLASAKGLCSTSGADQVEIEVTVEFEVLKAVDDLYVDFGLENKHGVRLIQVVPAARALSPVAVAVGSRPRFRFAARTTELAPGDYYGTIYAHSRARGGLLHQSNIALFRITPSERAPECMSEAFTATLLPNYDARIICEVSPR